MKRISARVFFTVVWKGVCQALGWFFGLFGYNREGKFAKCVWGLFSLSAAIIVAYVAGAMIYISCMDFYRIHCQASEDYCNTTYISRNVMMYSNEKDQSYILNTHTGKKTLKNIAWIRKPLGVQDSLIVFSNGKKRGYFNKFTGEVAIPAKYTRAWVFSDGIASVEEDGVIKFIDAHGNQMFDRTFTYYPSHDGYVFHGGYCVVDEDDDDRYGLINTQGVNVLPEEYSDISVSWNLRYWRLCKDNYSGVYNNELQPVLPMMECVLSVHADVIDVTMPDNTLRKYDLKGNLIDDFYIADFDYLEYDLEETYPNYERGYNEDKEEVVFLSGITHKTARARLGAYQAGNYHFGLMTPEGHVVTLPKYESIKAIGPDTYLCEVNHGEKEILNGRGERVK